MRAVALVLLWALTASAGWSASWNFYGNTDPYTVKYYVDSVGGLDTNAGTLAAPFQTLTKIRSLAGTMAPYTSINLKRGSSWTGATAYLSLQISNLLIQDYGTGALPIMDGRVAMPNASWSLTPTKTYTYQYSFTGINAGAEQHNIWENGVRLVRAASQAAVETTPGSYWIPAESAFAVGVPTILYMRTSASDSPITNAKAYITQGVDQNILIGSTTNLNAKVYNVEVMGGCHHNGNIQLGRSSYAQGVVSRWGTIHSVYTDSGYFVNCTSYDCEQGYDFVANSGSVSNGFIEMNGCLSDNVNTSLVCAGPGFFVHGTTETTIRYVNCISRHHVIGFGVNGIGQNAQTVFCSGCTATCETDPTAFHAFDINTSDFGGTFTSTVTIDRCFSDGFGFFLWGYNLNANTTINVTGARAIARGTANPAVQFRYGIVSVKYSSFFGPSSAYSALEMSEAAGRATWSYNIVDGFGLGIEDYGTVAGTNFTATNNVWHPSTGTTGPGFVLYGTYSATFAGYKTTASPQDGNAANGDPLWVQTPTTANNFAIQSGSPATALTAGWSFAP